MTTSRGMLAVLALALGFGVGGCATSAAGIAAAPNGDLWIIRNDGGTGFFAHITMLRCRGEASLACVKVPLAEVAALPPEQRPALPMAPGYSNPINAPTAPGWRWSGSQWEPAQP